MELLILFSEKKPLMGVCLGLQLLFDRSEEFEDCYGLGLVEGVVKKLPSNLEQNIKVPQIGWNTIYSKKRARLGKNPLEKHSIQRVYVLRSFLLCFAYSGDRHTNPNDLSSI